MAFIASGRFSVMTRTRSLRSVRTAGGSGVVVSWLMSSLLWRHPDATVDPDDLGIHIRVSDELHDHEGQFLA